MPVDEPADELLVPDRCGAHDDPRHPGLGERLGGVEVPDPATGLELHGEPVRDQADVLEVRGDAGPGAVEVDDVEPLGALRDEALRGLERRRRDLLDRREVAAGHPHDATVEDVDGRIDDHRLMVRTEGPRSAGPPRP